MRTPDGRIDWEAWALVAMTAGAVLAQIIGIGTSWVLR